MTEPNRQSGENEERIIEIEIERLRPFKEHPFQVKDDKEMFLLQESIEKYGILNPLIVRPVPDGYYEIISGHRRKHAAEKLGYRKVPVIIRVLSEDDSILSMVDSNLHRERISYSEKAFAYKLKNDVLKRKSGRKKSQVDHKTPRKRAIEIISVLRISRAKELLIRRPYTTLDGIAALCGYRDVSYFISVFRQQTGTTPKQFRKLYGI